MLLNCLKQEEEMSKSKDRVSKLKELRTESCDDVVRTVYWGRANEAE